jgi:DNA-directed RNA polymerase specialized sigma subunit
MFIDIEKTYLPQIDNIIKRYFPKYFERIKNLPQSKKKKIPILSQEELVELYFKYKEGDIHSRDLIIYSQLKLVYLYAKKFHITQNGTNISEEDLVGFANLILMEIIDDYVPFIEGKSELNNFSSFIRTWLEFNLHTELKKYGLAIKLPPNKITEISLQKKLISKYEQVNGESPRHGDQVDYCERGINKRAIFDVLNEKIEIYEKQENELVLIKSSKFDNLEVFEIKSGNEIINKDSDEVHLEVFDGIKSDPLIVLNFNDDIIKKSIEMVLDDLTQREREFVDLYYFRSEAIKRIPSLLTPDKNNEGEMKTLNKTSYNIVTVKANKKNSEEVFIAYEVFANAHDIPAGKNKADIDGMTAITHQNTELITNEVSDSYEFLLSNEIDLNSIEVKHKSCKNEENIKYSLNLTENGCILNFKINYSYGMIYTPQTFLNNNETLLKKLRTKLINLKKYI